jgi:uncharacterized RDD family membrane protein YckC
MSDRDHGPYPDRHADAQSPDHNPYAPPTPGTPPEPFADVTLLAGRSTRLGASLVDGLLALAAALPGLILIIVLGVSRGASVPEGDDVYALLSQESILPGVLLMLAGSLAFEIYQWTLIATTGQSLAKRWLGIRIVRLDGQLPGFGRGVVLRVWILLGLTSIPQVGWIIGLVDALFIFGSERRCLHDYLAGTRVVMA